MFGLLNINKPATWTSRDVINWLSQQARRVKIGHAGTLDPLATGVLVVCLGQATRLVPYLQAQPKTYVATFLLGHRSASDDVDTELEPIPDAPDVSTTQLLEVIPRFLGRIKQVPPIYSAIKVNGSRAYRKARKGKEVDIPEREIEVHRLELLSHDDNSFTLEIDCGSGTYVRSIGRDIARACGSGAVMSSLCRTRIGEFRVEDAIPPRDVQRHTIARQIVSALRAVPSHHPVHLNAEETDQVIHGMEVRVRPDMHVAVGEIALVDNHGELMALGDYDTERQSLIPKVVMRSPPGHRAEDDPSSAVGS